MKTPTITQVQEKKTVVIGDHLYLVEGAVRWGLYDLKMQALTVIDRRSGEFLAQLAEMSMSKEEKLAFIQSHAQAIWNRIQELGIKDRLFRPDTSIGPSGIPLDLLWLEVTDACNEKCVHCYAESGPMRRTYIPVELARRVIQQGCDEGFLKIQFVGGEPFAHRHLWEMVEYACHLGYPEVEIYTNLTLVRPSDLRRIKKLGIKLATSLLGHNAEIHDACTQTPGSFRLWHRNIKQVQALGIPYRIGVVRMRQNEQTMDEIEMFLRKEGLLAQDEPFNPDDVRPSGRGRSRDVLPTKPLDYGLYLTVNPFFFHLAQRYNPCWRGELAVAPTGAVYPCIFSRQLAVGNLNQESLSMILERLRQRFWNITLDQVERCRDCEFRYACMDCRALSFNMRRGLYGGPVRCNYDPYQSDRKDPGVS